VARIPAYLAREEPVTITLDLVLSLEDELERQFHAEMRRARWGVRWRSLLGVGIDA
jgi:hypothetical protein